MEAYDFIIAGAGLSGLSLACHIANSPLAGSSILIVDPSNQARTDRSYAFWSKDPTLFDPLISHSWDRLRFVSRQFQGELKTGRYRYNLVHGSDFFRGAREILGKLETISFRRGRVSAIQDGDESARVVIDRLPVHARYVFDGRGMGKAGVDGRSRHHTVKMHFLGWEITSDQAIFDPQIPTLMDFRTPQKGSTRFLYLLPLSKRRALVEYTVFSTRALPRPQYEQALRDYLADVIGLEEYQIARRESGCLPLTDRPFQRRLGKRVMAIGIRGGRLKPSTGYAFQRIHQDSTAIVRSLTTVGHPFAVSADPWRYRFSDSLLLEIMIKHGAEIEGIFSALFKNNPSERILRFLGQDASAWEQLRIIPTLPPRRFLEVLFGRLVPVANSLPGRHAHDRPVARQSIHSLNNRSYP